MRILTALSVSIVLALSACAPSAAPRAGPALWRISDSDSEIWLFGTVHVLPPALAWRTPRLDAAFAAADELVVETDAEDARTAAALTARFGVAPEGERLSALLDPPTVTQLMRVCAQLGVEPESLERLRPWLAALRLSFTFATQRGHSQAAGVESVLLADARAQGKRISYLETPEQQIRSLAELSPAEQLRFLQASLDQIEHQGDSLDALDRAWAAGDVDAIDAQMRAQLTEAGASVFDAIITRRNRAWVEQISQRLEGSGRVFYAVGSAHLVGDEGVVAQLRARGIAVEGP